MKEEKIAPATVVVTISSDYVPLGAMVIDFQRTPDGPHERGIAVMRDEATIHQIVDVEGKLVQELWTFAAVPYEGCFNTMVEVFS